jgi:hypothetical protein
MSETDFFDSASSSTNDFGGDFLDGGSSVAPLDKHADLLKELTNFDPSIQSRMRYWLGLEWDNEAQAYIQKRRPLINEDGVRWALSTLQTYQAKTNIITNLNHDEHIYMHLDIINVIWLTFPTMDEFDVKSNQDWYKLCTELEHAALLVLYGAGDGKYTKFIGESVQRHEHVNLGGMPNNNMQVKKAGILQKIKSIIPGMK